MQKKHKEKKADHWRVPCPMNKIPRARWAKEHNLVHLQAKTVPMNSFLGELSQWLLNYCIHNVLSRWADRWMNEWKNFGNGGKMLMCETYLYWIQGLLTESDWPERSECKSNQIQINLQATIHGRGVGYKIDFKLTQGIKELRCIVCWGILKKNDKTSIN